MPNGPKDAELPFGSLLSLQSRARGDYGGGRGILLHLPHLGLLLVGGEATRTQKGEELVADLANDMAPIPCDRLTLNVDPADQGEAQAK